MTTLHVAEDPSEDPPWFYRLRPGGSFILDSLESPEPIWGRGEEVLLADGEALIIAGGQGVGKTTLAQQLALGRCGIPEYATLLGYPITPGNRRTLYLAMDRPRQAARSFRRMVGQAYRAELDDALVIWPGPPPLDLSANPTMLRELCRTADADSVFVDSLKDAALGLNDDTVASGYNRARQHVLADGIQVTELHHPRKQTNGTTRAATGIDDVYGSTWLTSGAGSVLLLTGAPGDPLVTMSHVKQPALQVPDMQLLHDHIHGRTTVSEAADFVALALGTPGGISAAEASMQVYGDATPKNKAKAARALASAEKRGELVLVQKGDQRTSTPARWGAP